MESFFETIEAELNGEPDDPTGCIKATDDLINEIINRENEIPNGIKIIRCDNGQTNDHHHWVEVTIPNGQVYVWDRSGTKIGPMHWLPLQDATALWPGFNQPENSLQIFPPFEE